MEDEEFFDSEVEYNGKYAVLFRKESFEGKPAGNMNEQTDLRVWLRALLEDETLEGYKDVEFVVGNAEKEKKIKAHRLVLATRSATFAKLLKEHEDDKEIKITDTSSEIFDAIIRYIYTGKLPSPQRVLETVHLLHAAHVYDMHYLYDVMKQFLLQRLPHFRPRHFIMVTQQVLDLDITDLEKPCFDIVQDSTDSVLMDPLFLRVSEKFIKKLLERDTFSGISEAAVFTRVLEWAHLKVPRDRSSSSSSSSSSDEEKKKSKKKRGTEFELQKPDVRRTMDSFIRDFRLVSVPRDSLAGLVKNSGVFTEHEQLMVSYYLLDQTKNLGEFTMKPRGTKQRILANAGRTSPKLPIKIAAPNFEPPPPPSNNGTANQPKPTKPANGGESVFYSKAPPGYTEVSVDEMPPKMHVPLRSQSSDGPVSVPYTIIRDQKEPDSSNFVDKLRQKFALEKVSQRPFRIVSETIYRSYYKLPPQKKGKESKAAKSRGKSIERPPSNASLTEMIRKEGASKKSSSSSSSSSAASSPARTRPARPIETKVTRDDSAVHVGVMLREKPPVAHRPKSVLVDDVMVVSMEKRDSKDAGKKGSVMNGLSGIMGKTMKWSPERPPADIGRPSAPPRVKGHGNHPPVNNDIVADI